MDTSKLRPYKVKGRHTDTITKAEIEACAVSSSFTAASRKLNCSYDMIKRFVKEKYPDLYDVFIANGLTNQYNSFRKR